MKTIRQLLRQPMKTIMGILLAALAAAVLCVCVGQSISATKIDRYLNGVFASQALPTANYTREADEWALQYAQDHPDIVKEIGDPGLISGYVQGLQPDSYTSYIDLRKKATDNSLLSTDTDMNTEYGWAILEIQVDKIGNITLESVYTEDNNTFYWYKTDRVSVIIRGTILNVIAMNQTHTDPTGYQVQMELVMENQAALDELGLEVGGRYLIYTDSYADVDWQLRSELSLTVEEYGGLIPVFDHANLSSEMELDVPIISKQDLWPEPMEVVATYHMLGHPYENEDGDTVRQIYTFDLSYTDLAKYRTIQCVVWDEGTGPVEQISFTEDGKFQVDIPETRTYYTADGTATQISLEEYAALYSRPSIVRLEGTAQEFLDSPEGEAWQAALREIEVNNHAYPFIGVDSMNDIPDFAASKATVTQGRNFTEAELSSGTQVCLISDILAELNGLEVGDVIYPQFYERDPNLGVGITEGYGVSNPLAYAYSDSNTPLGEPEAYTIVGIYTQNIVRENPDNNAYAFRPNTIFIPKASVSLKVDESYRGMFRSFVLENGCLEQFSSAALAAGYSHQMKFDDNNFDAVEGTLQAYTRNAGVMLCIGLVAYVIVLVLLVVLYPLQQGQALRLMDALGADRTRRTGHMLLQNAVIFLPGTLLGIGTSVAIWDWISQTLMDGGGMLAVEIDLGMLVIIGTLHLAGLLGIVLACARVMTRQQNLMQSKEQVLELGKTKRRQSAPTVAVVLLGVGLTVSLCGLQTMGQAELANYEDLMENYPILAVVTNRTGSQDDYLEARSDVIFAITSEFALGAYFPYEDVAFKCSYGIENVVINNRTVDCEKLIGITDRSADSVLAQSSSDIITWLTGYDDSIFEKTIPYCVIPQEYLPADRNGLVTVNFTVRKDGVTSEAKLYVVGTHQCQEKVIFCSLGTLKNITNVVSAELNYDRVVAVLADNTMRGTIWDDAAEWFSPVDPIYGSNYNWADMKNEEDAYSKTAFSLKLQDEELELAEQALETSQKISTVCTVAVFGLSVAASFLVGFLMIRGRKREIFLMRTLGTSPIRIYWNLAKELMVLFLGGVVLGGLFFLWQPAQQIGILIGIFFVGLSVAMLVFLSNNLMTTNKEDE